MKKIHLLLLTFFCCTALMAESQSELFERTVKHLDRGGLTFQYQDLGNMNSQINALFDVFGKTYVNDPIQQMIYNNFLSLIKSMNFDELQSFGSSTKQLGPNLFANKLFVAVKPGAHGSLCSLSGTKNIKFNLGKNLSADAIIAMGAYWDWQGFYGAVEKAYGQKNELQSMSAVFEQSFGMKLNDLLANMSGEFFAGIFKGGKKNEFHFVIVLPDNQSKFKVLAQKYFGPTLQVHNNGTASFTMPVAASDFGSGVTAWFADRKVYIYNSNAPLEKLLNTSGKNKKLSAVYPAIFNVLNNNECNSFMVMNLDIQTIDSKLAKRVYRYGSICKFTGDGYLVDGKSNFNLQNIAEYTPLFELLPNLVETKDPIVKR